MSAVFCYWFILYFQRIPLQIFVFELLNYQILLIVHWQVSGQNLLDQPRFTCPKMDLFHISQRKHTVWPQWLEHGWLDYRGWFELFFQSLQNSSNSSRKQIFRDFFSFYHGIVCCVYSSELPHWGNSNKYTRHTIVVVENRKEFPKLSLFASWTGAMINP